VSATFVYELAYVDAAMDTATYDEFADGPWLTRKAMEWFWDAYIADPAQRLEITASPSHIGCTRRATVACAESHGDEGLRRALVASLTVRAPAHRNSLHSDSVIPSMGRSC
jgi:acetyl esterase/lipase